MSFYVYLIKTINRNPIKTYVGYTNNIKLRLNAHNGNKGAKSTKGYKWELIYKKSFKTKGNGKKMTVYFSQMAISRI